MNLVYWSQEAAETLHSLALLFLVGSEVSCLIYLVGTPIGHLWARPWEPAEPHDPLLCRSAPVPPCPPSTAASPFLALLTV